MSETNPVSPLRQRMIEDMAARQLNPHTQRSHIYSCKRFAAWLKRSPDTATPDEVRLFQLHLVESGASICNRNRIMTGVRFLFRVTLRHHDLAAEIWHMKEPQKLPPVLSPEEIKRVLTMATSLKARAMLSLAYGCGLRASEVVRLRACDIDSEQMIIRVVQSKGRKDRNVMLPAKILDLLRQWWKARPTRRGRRRAGTTLVVSRSRWSSDDAPVRPAVQGGGEDRGVAQGGLPSFAASFLRDPSARGRRAQDRIRGADAHRRADRDRRLLRDEIDQIVLDDEGDAVEQGPLAPRADAVAVARPGDVFQLGPHRVICGSATDLETLRRLMDGDEPARLVLTDEPYNMRISRHVTGGAHREFAMASGEMSDAEFLDFDIAWMEVTLPCLCDGGVFGTFIDWRATGRSSPGPRSWLKPTRPHRLGQPDAGMGRRYRSQHELLPLFKNRRYPHLNRPRLGREKGILRRGHCACLAA